MSQSIHYTTQHAVTNWNFNNSSCTFYSIAFLDLSIRAHQYSPNMIFFKVQHHTINITREHQQFTGHCLIQSLNKRNTVTYTDDSPYIVRFNFIFVMTNLFLDQSTDFFWSKFHILTSFPLTVHSSCVQVLTSSMHQSLHLQAQS